MDIRKVFGANARKFRLALGLSQEAVAERMGVDRAFIQQHGTRAAKCNPPYNLGNGSGAGGSAGGFAGRKNIQGS
jgi:helix-turn-helix protein